MLKGTALRLFRLVHVGSAGVWLGALTGIVALHLVRFPGGRAQLGLDLAAYQLNEIVLTWAFVVTTVTGLAFSAFSAWGFAVHRWVALKWLLAAGLFTATMAFQSPALSGVIGLSDAGLAEFKGLRYEDFRAESLRVALAQLGIVAVVFAISTLKPWGRFQRTFDVGRKWIVGGVVASAAIGVAMTVMMQMNFHRLRSAPVAAVDLARVSDGTHRGRAECDMTYEVDVRVAGHRIEAVEVVANRTTHYARIAEAVGQRIVERQRAEVDVITGASTTSRCLMRAVGAALAEARP